MTGYPILTAQANELDCALPKLTVQFNFDRPTNRRRLTTVTLSPGFVDDDAIEFFAWANCDFLAGAIHEKTGWPLAAVEHTPQGRTEFKSRWRHVGVLTPDGRFLDIFGPRHLERYSDGQPVQRVTLQQLVDDELMASPWHAPINLPAITEVVRYFADTLIARVAAP